MAALLRLGQDTFVLGMQLPETNDLFPQTATPATDDDKNRIEAIQIHTSTVLDEILAMKRGIIEQFSAMLAAAGRIGWKFVLENTCVYLWNYHFHLFRMVTAPSVSNAAQAILPECVAALEAAYQSMDSFSGVDMELFASLALGLIATYEKMARWEKVLAIAESFLKRKSAASSLSPANSATSSDANLEALENSFQQGQSGNKNLALYQKAVALWQGSLSQEVFAAFQENSLELTLEAVQQQREVYVELWVRLGYAAFRLHNFRFAIGCATQSLLALPAEPHSQGHKVLFPGSVWRWLAASEILCGRAILALGNGDEGAIPRQLVLAALEHLVHAAEYGHRSNAGALIIKASEIVWNAVLMAMNASSSPNATTDYDTPTMKEIIKRLRQALRFLSEANTKSGSQQLPRQYGDLVLLTLSVCEKGSEWKDARDVCEDALAAASSFGTEIANEIHAAHAIAIAHLGTDQAGKARGTGAGSGKRSDQQQDPILRAKILKKIAFSSMKDPPAQLTALASAYGELDGKPEEQALVLLDLAEWFFSNRVAGQDIDAYLDTAVKLLLANELSAEDARSKSCAVDSRTPSRTGQLARANSMSALKSQQEPIVTYSGLWRDEKLLRIFVMRAITFSAVNEMELQDAFTKAGITDVDFDEWKRNQKAKYEPPTSSREWISMYSRYAKSPDARFFMEWTSKLTSMQSAVVLHFTEPVVTGVYLEKLLGMLHDGLLDEIALPTICLYQVLFHRYTAKKTKIMELWLELTMFGVLERLNATGACGLPLQSALERFQTHGKTILEELQQAEESSAQVAGRYASKGIQCPIVQSSSASVLDKMLHTTELFLRFGYVHQAKTALEMLKYTLRDGDYARQSELHILFGYVYDVEGHMESALAESQQALQSLSFDLQKMVRWTIRCCDILNATESYEHGIKLLENTEKRLTKWLLSFSPSDDAMASRGNASTASSIWGELDILTWIAQLKCKRASLLLKHGASCKSQGQEVGGKNNSDCVQILTQSRNVFSKCVQILTQLDCKPTLSQCLVANVKEWLGVHAAIDRNIDSSALDIGEFTRSNLQQAIIKMEALRLQIRQFYEKSCSSTSAGLESIESSSSAFASPLEIQLTVAKCTLASIEIAIETPPAKIKEEEMTYGIQKLRGGDLAFAMMLATSAAAILRHSGLDENVLLAKLQVLQCQRLALFHSESRLVTEKVRHKLWTKFTSADALQSIAQVDQGDREDLTSSQDDLMENEKIESFLTDCSTQLQNIQKLVLEKRDYKLLRLCPYELVQVYGCHRPLDCIRSLLLYQSVVARDHLTEVFHRCVSPRDVQQLHLRRMQRLQDTHTNAMQNSPSYQLSLMYLDQQSSAFKRMSVAVPVDTILGALPPRKCILSFQFSPDKCFLYGAMAGSGEKQYAIARIECTEPMMKAFDQLRDRVRRWRRAYTKMLAELEELHANDPNFEFSATDSVVNHALSSENDVLEKEFSAILVDTNDLFAPLLSHSSLQSTLQNELVGTALVLLVDRELECLPLESLPVLEKAESITRDFSVHVLYQRLQMQKAQPLKRDDMRYIVDPYRDDPSLEDQTMESAMHRHVKRAGGAFTNWKEAVEHGQPPTKTDWQYTLLNRRGGGLFFLGANRVLGSCLSFHDLTAMSMALSCHVACLLDRAENPSSVRRQSKVDSEKDAWQLELEDDAYANAMLWSLSGVNILVTNQWPTTFNGDRRRASGLFAGLAKGFSIGKALKKYGELISPSGALASAPPSTTTSATSSSSNLPPPGGNTSTSTGAPSTSNSNSSSALQPDGTSPTNLQKMASASGKTASQLGKQRLKNRTRYNTVVYGLAHIALKSPE
ncbi:Tetratricopeptide repeat protein 40, partial [Globisporangium splendens]